MYIGRLIVLFWRAAYSMGKGAAAGAAAVGLGALCYYGVGLGKQTSIADNAM